MNPKSWHVPHVGVGPKLPKDGSNGIVADSPCGGRAQEMGVKLSILFPLSAIIY